MNKQKLKPILIGLLMIWLLLFITDSIFGISWPNYMMHRVFVWTPTVLIAVYWLAFGGTKKNN